MEYEFELTEKANNDIEGILYYLSKELMTPKSATHFMDALMKGRCLNRLTNGPW